MSKESSASGDAQPGSSGGHWLSKASRFAPRVANMIREEVETLTWRKLLVDGAALLPQQSLNRVRTAALRAAGMQMGVQSLIQGPVRITGAGNPCRSVSIGSFTILSGHLHIDVAAPVRIGSGVRIGHDVSLLTISHQIGTPALRSGKSFSGPITIGDGVWIASRVTVLANVTIGQGAVVAAGSVVTRDVPPHTLVAGVPARALRTLDETMPAESEL